LRFLATGVAAFLFAISTQGMAAAVFSPAAFSIPASAPIVAVVDTSVDFLPPVSSLSAKTLRLDAAPERLAQQNDLDTLPASQATRLLALAPLMHFLEPTIPHLERLEVRRDAVGTDRSPASNTRHTSSVNGETISIDHHMLSLTLAKRVITQAMHLLGTPYLFGGTTANGFDCSGYVQHVFARVGIALPRTADQQYLVGHRVDTAHLSEGDLVFFQTYSSGVSHVGIYVGHDTFVHSSTRGVMISSLDEPYWSERYLGAERIIGDTSS